MRVRRFELDSRRKETAGAMTTFSWISLRTLSVRRINCENLFCRDINRVKNEIQECLKKHGSRSAENNDVCSMKKIKVNVSQSDMHYRNNYYK